VDLESLFTVPICADDRQAAGDDIDCRWGLYDGTCNPPLQTVLSLVELALPSKATSRFDHIATRNLGKPILYQRISGPPFRIPATFFYRSQSAMFHLQIHQDAKQFNKEALSTAWQSL